jgi:hypothetical protein
LKTCCIICVLVSIKCHLFNKYLLLFKSHKEQNFWERKLLNVKCVFLFSLQLLFDTFLILRIQWGLHVKYPLFLSDFNGTWIFSIDFWTVLKYQISWKSIQWELSCSMQAVEQTDMTKLIATFLNFLNTPKTYIFDILELKWHILEI